MYPCGNLNNQVVPVLRINSVSQLGLGTRHLCSYLFMDFDTWILVGFFLSTSVGFVNMMPLNIFYVQKITVFFVNVSALWYR